MCVPDGSNQGRNAAAQIRNPGLLMGRSAAKFCIMAPEVMFPFIRQRMNSVEKRERKEERERERLTHWESWDLQTKLTYL